MLAAITHLSLFPCLPWPSLTQSVPFPLCSSQYWIPLKIVKYDEEGDGAGGGGDGDGGGRDGRLDGGGGDGDGGGGGGGGSMTIGVPDAQSVQPP